MLKRLVRAGLQRLGAAPTPASRLVVARRVGDGFVDELTVHDDRVLSVRGWAPDLEAFLAALTLALDGRPAPVTHAYRLIRPDIPGPTADGTGFAGAVVEWLLPERACQVTLATPTGTLAAFDVPAGPAPAYEALRHTRDILHREHIYGSGPPVHEVAPEALALALTLPEPILDFGCGGGALVRALRAEGREVFGLELDEPRIRQHLLPEAASVVTLYDGDGPAPFHDGQFASVTCCEVLEHMPDPYRAVAELARLGRRRLLITVPDMSAIPRGFHHGVVPWHLLEATHVNFFTQESLTTALLPFAERVDMARIGAVRVGDLTFHSSLAACVTLKPRQ